MSNGSSGVPRPTLEMTTPPRTLSNEDRKRTLRAAKSALNRFMLGRSVVLAGHDEAVRRSAPVAACGHPQEGAQCALCLPRGRRRGPDKAAPFTLTQKVTSHGVRVEHHKLSCFSLKSWSPQARPAGTQRQRCRFGTRGRRNLKSHPVQHKFNLPCRNSGRSLE